MISEFSVHDACLPLSLFALLRAPFAPEGSVVLATLPQFPRGQSKDFADCPKKRTGANVFVTEPRWYEQPQAHLPFTGLVMISPRFIAPIRSRNCFTRSPILSSGAFAPCSAASMPAAMVSRRPRRVCAVLNGRKLPASRAPAAYWI